MTLLKVNPNGGNGTMIITLPGVKPHHAGRVETLAFKHGKAGVGHTFYNPKRLIENGNIRVWRKPGGNDPGQPAGWTELVPFVDGGLADHIRALSRMSSDAERDGEFVQALVFQSVREGLAFQAAMTSARETRAGRPQHER